MTVKQGLLTRLCNMLDELAGGEKIISGVNMARTSGFISFDFTGQLPADFQERLQREIGNEYTAEVDGQVLTIYRRRLNP